MSTQYSHLNLDDRTQIELLLERGKSQAEIARHLGVHRCTILRELRRNSWQPERDHANLRPYLRNKLDTRSPHDRLYLAGQAHLQADTRKQHSHAPYRMTYDRLIDWVISQLRCGWTPEEISGRLPIEFPDNPRMRVSVETLYVWIYAPEQQHRQLHQYLARGQKKRRRIKGRQVYRERIKHRVSIQDRPREVDTRDSFGHWESDSVLGSHSTGAIHTTVERKSRFYVGVKIQSVAAEAPLCAQLGIYQALPAHAVCSITADNGSEFAYHYQLADTIGVPTYFADPYAAYQRGTNEHFNGRLRKYLAKGTSFADLSQAKLDAIIREINNRPRKVLDWATPAEVFGELCSG